MDECKYCHSDIIKRKPIEDNPLIYVLLDVKKKRLVCSIKGIANTIRITNIMCCPKCGRELGD